MLSHERMTRKAQHAAQRRTVRYFGFYSFNKETVSGDTEVAGNTASDKDKDA